MRDISAHIKQYHLYTLDDSKLAILKRLLEEELDLEHPSMVEVKKELLPVPYIPELDISYDGRHCMVCPYSVKSRLAIKEHAQQHEHAAGAIKHDRNDANQLFWSSSFRRYVHASHPTFLQAPPQLPPAALRTAMSADKLDGAAKAKVSAVLQTDKELLHSAGLLTLQIQPREYTGNLGPWRVPWTGRCTGLASPPPPLAS